MLDRSSNKRLLNSALSLEPQLGLVNRSREPPQLPYAIRHHRCLLLLTSHSEFLTIVEHGAQRLKRNKNEKMTMKKEWSFHLISFNTSDKICMNLQCVRRSSVLIHNLQAQFYHPNDDIIRKWPCNLSCSTTAVAECGV